MLYFASLDLRKTLETYTNASTLTEFATLSKIRYAQTRFASS